MKKLWAVIVLLLVAGGIYFLENKNAAPKNAALSGTPISANDSSATNPVNSGKNSAAPFAAAKGADDLAARAASPNPSPATNEIPPLPPATVLDNARVAIHNYAAAFGENPVGDNAEITAALTGKNPRQINFIAAESGLHVNANGELLDGFGTPFFFHQLSGHEMEIRSAGEDRKMWTFDDQVTR